jgi:hypothetical protein
MTCSDIERSNNSKALSDHRHSLFQTKNIQKHHGNIALNTFNLDTRQNTLVRGDHVLDIDECIFTASHLELFQRLLNQIADILALLL